MTNAIIHLILIQSNEQIGMDEITRRIATALSGDVIQLVPVMVPKPVTPPVVVPPIVPPPVIIRKVRVKAGMVGWVRTKPDATSPAISSFRYAGGAWPILESRTGWERIGVGWIDSTVLEYS